MPLGMAISRGAEELRRTDEIPVCDRHLAAREAACADTDRISSSATHEACISRQSCRDTTCRKLERHLLRAGRRRCCQGPATCGEKDSLGRVLTRPLYRPPKHFSLSYIICTMPCSPPTAALFLLT